MLGRSIRLGLAISALAPAGTGWATTTTPTRNLTPTCTASRTGTRPPSPTPCDSDHIQQCVALPTPTLRPTLCSGQPDTRIFTVCSCEACEECPLGEVRDCPQQRGCDCSCAPPTPSPTPTRLPRGCPGDCDRDGIVHVSEIIRAVRIVLGTLPASACAGYDPATICDLVA